MKSEIADNLNNLAHLMNKIANKMIDFANDMDCVELSEKLALNAHANELLMAAIVTNEWADEIGSVRKQNRTTD
jgi:hypothetical protein